MSKNDRRDFLRGLGSVVMAGGAAAFLPQLRLLGTAMAAELPKGGNDYRALVCVYLGGGNDAYNMLVPRAQSAYNVYQATRGGIYNPQSNPSGLALARETLLPVSPLGGGDFGLHPSCAGMQALFQQQRLAFVANVGALVQPTTKQQYLDRSVPLPPELFSHNSQTTLWHNSRTDLRHPFGWGGDIASRIDTGAVPGGLSPCISIAGNARYLLGPQIKPYQMRTTGPVPLSTGSTGLNTAGRARRDQAIQEMLALDYDHLFEREYRGVLKRSLDLHDVIRAELDADPPLDTVFPAENSLASQLRMVAQMIRASRRPAINHRRQIYYVSLGGFDTHGGQMAANGQPLLMERLSQALAAFQSALAEIGAASDVVTFSMSEFARTLTTNGNGSDHAWGSVQLVMGAPVSGQRVFGTYPVLDIDGAGTLTRGRVVPTLAVDQIASTLARWMGVSDIALDTIFPNLGNFSPRTLPFLPL
ncbi:MAG TPA: DUF1501 domain-containing protein [Xanthomonadaceae bacterium]|nr:DUF1501 domain-containing protein [Xanthomonadaceae bacterium]